MKPAFVSVALPLLLLVPPHEEIATILIRGRVTSAATAAGLEAANIRIIAAGVSVAPSPLASIASCSGFLPRTRAPAAGAGHRLQAGHQERQLASDTTTADFALEVDVNRLNEVVVSGVTGATELKSLPFTVAYANPPITGAGNPAVSAQEIPGRFRKPDSTESYDRIVDNPFLGARDNPLSTFSVDVDRASYSNIRRFVMLGQRPPKDAVRIEEMVNYFSYALPEPESRHPFSVSAEVAHAPWHEKNLLVRVGLQARRLPATRLPPSNLIFLIDVSGSMMPPEKLPLVQDAMRLLVNQLRERLPCGHRRLRRCRRARVAVDTRRPEGVDPWRD